MLSPNGLPPLASRLYLIAHDDRAGRRRLHPRAVGLGLAAGLLGELVLWQCLDISDGVVGLLACRPPDDRRLQRILDDMRYQSQHREVRVWLAYLAEVAGDMV